MRTKWRFVASLWALPKDGRIMIIAIFRRASFWFCCYFRLRSRTFRWRLTSKEATHRSPARNRPVANSGVAICCVVVVTSVRWCCHLWRTVLPLVNALLSYISVPLSPLACWSWRLLKRCSSAKNIFSNQGHQVTWVSYLTVVDKRLIRPSLSRTKKQKRHISCSQQTGAV